jgi:hypothetical protein
VRHFVFSGAVYLTQSTFYVPSSKIVARFVIFLLQPRVVNKRALPDYANLYRVQANYSILCFRGRRGKTASIPNYTAIPGNHIKPDILADIIPTVIVPKNGWVVKMSLYLTIPFITYPSPAFLIPVKCLFANIMPVWPTFNRTALQNIRIFGFGPNDELRKNAAHRSFVV